MSILFCAFCFDFVIQVQPSNLPRHHPAKPILACHCYVSRTLLSSIRATWPGQHLKLYPCKYILFFFGIYVLLNNINQNHPFNNLIKLTEDWPVDLRKHKKLRFIKKLVLESATTVTGCTVHSGRHPFFK